MTTLNKTTWARTSLVVLYSQNYAARTLDAGTTMNLRIVLNTPKNPYLNQATPKKYSPNFPTQKNPGIKNFKPQKLLRSSPSLEIRSTPPPPRALTTFPLTQSLHHVFTDQWARTAGSFSVFCSFSYPVEPWLLGEFPFRITVPQFSKIISTLHCGCGAR